MGITELLLVAVGLSMDAFAVSMCKGLCMQRFQKRNALIMAGMFGGFQAGMPLIGWVLGRQFERYITAVDHWIAFVLLGFIGGKMLLDARRPEKDDAPRSCPSEPERLDFREMLALAVATSIDALAVGITFAFLKVKIFPAVSLIGTVTFLLSLIGVAIGFRFGAKYEKKAQIAGGAVLVLIGLKILLEHLGVF